jgi:hypothetical protein
VGRFKEARWQVAKIGRLVDVGQGGSSAWRPAAASRWRVTAITVGVLQVMPPNSACSMAGVAWRRPTSP